MSDATDKTYIVAQVTLFCATAFEPVISAGDVGTLVDTVQVARTWAAATAYAIDAEIMTRPTVENGHLYCVVTPGTSGATEPTWPKTKCSTVTDGTVVWKECGESGKYAYDRERAIHRGWELKAARAAHLVQIEGREWEKVYEHCLQQVILTAPEGTYSAEKLKSLRLKSKPKHEDVD